MRVERLSLTTFRSYSALDVSFADGPQVVVGPNATGKTSLLESILVLGTARSHRAGQDGELVSWGAEFARLEAEVVGTAQGSDTVELVIVRTATGGGRPRWPEPASARRLWPSCP